MFNFKFGKFVMLLVLSAVSAGGINAQDGGAVPISFEDTELSLLQGADLLSAQVQLRSVNEHYLQTLRMADQQIALGRLREAARLEGVAEIELQRGLLELLTAYGFRSEENLLKGSIFFDELIDNIEVKVGSRGSAVGDNPEDPCSRFNRSTTTQAKNAQGIIQTYLLSSKTLSLFCQGIQTRFGPKTGHYIVEWHQNGRNGVCIEVDQVKNSLIQACGNGFVVESFPLLRFNIGYAEKIHTIGQPGQPSHQTCDLDANSISSFKYRPHQYCTYCSSLGYWESDICRSGYETTFLGEQACIGRTGGWFRYKSYQYLFSERALTCKPNRDYIACQSPTSTSSYFKSSDSTRTFKSDCYFNSGYPTSLSPGASVSR